MVDRFANFARVAGVLVAMTLAGCASTPEAARIPEAPRLLPFTYGRASFGSFNGGVRAILEDRDGSFWFGSHLEGVCRVDGGRIRHFTRADGLGDDQIRSIQEAPDGSIWFDTGSGVSSFEVGRIMRRADGGLRSIAPWTLDPGDLWFKADEANGFPEPGVLRLREGRLDFLAFPATPLRRDGALHDVTGFARGAGGRLWIATYEAVFGFDGSSVAVIDGERMGLRGGEGVPHVRCVFEDSRGRVWIGNNGVGVVVVDGDATYGLAPLAGEGDALLRMGAPLAASVAADSDESLQRVFSIGEDRDGDIWFGTIDGGAWRYDGRVLRQFTAEDGLTTPHVMSIYRDRDGVLWLGGNGVFRFDGRRFERVH